MDKLIEYKVKREISKIKISHDISAYKEQIYIDDKLFKTNEGLANNVILDNLDSNISIDSSKYRLYKAEILEELRNTLLFHDYKSIDKFEIENPYSYISINGLKDSITLYVNYSNYNIYNLNGEQCPKAFRFDYNSGSVNNENYNLEEFLEVIKKREDILLYKDEIQDIPYYNTDEDCYEHIEFNWIPSNEDFNKVSNMDNYRAHKYIIKEIFKINSIQ